MEINREDIFSVSEASKLVKNIIKTNLPSLWIEGEIANYVHHSSGHIYFSLKDDNSTIRVAFFRQYNLSLSFQPKNGDKVLCYGKIDVYEKTGTYQLIASNMLPGGIGELQLKFLALKEKLASEGLFSAELKKQLPPYPEKIGVITSATGAAFQDIKNVITRRFPHNLYLYPASVQGDRSIPELVAGIEYFNTTLNVDLIIIGRGGGSQEDLFCFNDERLARAVFASEIPVLSAVGHEIDFTIIDFVADVRAPTPSAAAELAVPNKADLIEKLAAYSKSLFSKAERELLLYRQAVAQHQKHLYQWHPQAVLFKYQQRLDEAKSKFATHLKDTEALRYRLDKASDKLIYAAEKGISDKVHKERLTINKLSHSLLSFTHKQVEALKSDLRNKEETLNSFSPELAMKRGYAVIRKEKMLLKSVKNISKDDKILVSLQDGCCDCTVDQVRKK